VKLTLTRSFKTAQSSMGIMWLDALPFCYTLEPMIAIPAGTTYAARLEESPKLGFVTPRLFGVPGYPNDDILIHAGNFPENTTGCILVGHSQEFDYVGESDVCFSDLMKRLPLEFNVTIRDVGFMLPVQPGSNEV
jgi:hypothetical protein